MQLGCTKKLLDALKVKPAPSAVEDPFFSWSASITTANRRKLVTVMNDACFCGFALYGMKAKDMKQLKEYVFSGIRGLLEALQYEPGLIDQYMRDCGDSLDLTSTRNRSVVARLNHCTSRVEFFTDRFNPDSLLQKHLLWVIANDYATINGEFICTTKLLEEAMDRHYHPAKMYQYRMVDLSIDLQLERPCTRRVLLPQCATLKTLHDAIQKLFCWKDYHLHEFHADSETPLDAAFPAYAHLAEATEFDVRDCSRMEQAISLKEAFSEYPELCYLYDFGDGWEHIIHLNGFLDDAGSGIPLCVLAMGDAPPEDVGGSLGYEDFLRIMADPSDDEHQTTKEWADGMEWKPLNMEEINRELRRML